MADLAELGFVVRTDGLREGKLQLDVLSQAAKKTEEQAKRTSDALAKSSDGAKKLGQDSRAAAEGEAAMSKQAQAVADSLDKQIVKMQLTSAEYRVLQNLQKAGTTLDTEAGRAIAARALALEASRAGTQRAAVSNGELGAALQALFPSMTAVTTATKAMAIEKQALAVNSANAATALNMLRPAVGGAGGAISSLAPLAASARGGLIGLGLAAAGGAAVGLAKYGDQVEDARGKLGALVGSSEGGRRAFDNLKVASERGGAGMDQLSKSVVDVVTGLARIESPPGVYQVGNQAEQSAVKVTAAFGEINRVIAGLRIPESSFKPALDALTKGLADASNQGKLTGDTFRQIQNASPELARALAAAFNQTNVENFRRSLDVTPRSIDQITNALKQLDLANVKGLDPSRAETFDQAIAKVDRSWGNLKQSMTDAGAFGFAAKGIDEVAQGISGLSKLIDAARNGSLKFDFGLSDSAKDFLQKLKDEFKSTGSEGAKFSDVLDGVGQSGDALSRSEAASVIEGINKSLVGFADVGTDIQNAAQATGEFATQLPIAAEASTAFAGTTTEQMGAATTAIGQTGQSAASFAQGFDGSMASAAAAAEQSSQRIVSAMQSIIDAVNAAAAAQAAAGAGGGGGGGAIDTGVGSAPYAKGGVFDQGGVVPMARGGVVDRSTIIPLATGAAINIGEAGPEAVMPLQRGSDGRLGVTVNGGSSAGIPFDPVDAIETALKDQTQELRTAIGDSGDNLSTRFSRKLDEVIAAIERGNIKASQAADSPAKTFDSAAGTFDTAVQQFGESVQVASGGGQYTSSQSFAPAGATPGSPGGGAGLRTTVLLSSGSSGGSSGSDIAAALGFYDAWGGGSARGGGDNLLGGGSAAPMRQPSVPYFTGGGGGSRGGIQEPTPAGVGGAYSEPTVRPLTPSREIGGGSITPTYGPEYADYGGYGGDYYAGAGATGLSGVVPGSGGTDSVLFTAHVTPGERYEFTPAGQSGGGNGGVTIDKVIIQANDIQSFVKNEHLIAGQLNRMLEKYQARR